MKQKYRFITICLLSVFLFVYLGFGASSGKIQGFVKDKVSGEPLPGANIVIKGTGLGAATDMEGYYIILNVPPGEYTLEVYYIGYKKKEARVKVLANQTVVQNFELEYTVIKGKEVEVTAQAEGQMEAINKQLSSLNIKNVVSSDRIQEIPDANAAESVARLPGVSILRSGGEGNKVIIRGLAPKYNKITIDGVTLASTSSGDRSNDLSMISPYMLAGIELTKANLPDQEADILGGTVNFTIRKAGPKPRLDALFQGGYNSQRNSYDNYKFVLGGSKRFFKQHFGVLAQVDIEQRNNSSYEMSANYTINNPTLDAPNVVSITNLQLKDIYRKVRRYGGTLVLDVKHDNGWVKWSNFGSWIVKQTINRNETYDVDGVSHNYNLNDFESWVGIFTSSLKFDHNFKGLNIQGGISGTSARNKIPDQLIFSATESGAFYNNLDPYAPPTEIPNFAKNDLDAAFLNNIARVNSLTNESEFSVNLDFKYPLRFRHFLGGFFKFGGKYKYKSRKYDIERKRVPIDWGGRQEERDAILKAFPWMQEVAPLGSKRLPYSLFIDKSYNPNNFLGGNYSIHAMPDLDLAWQIAHLLEGSYFYDYQNSIRDDYNGSENYRAAYAMFSLEFSQKIMFLPGFRYEANQTKYTGIRGNSEALKWNEGYVHTDTTTIRTNSFFLPMIHLRIKPTKWFDIRLAYTHTLSRPDYNRIRPSWDIGLNVVKWNNPYLKPALSKNYDVYFYFYGNTLGLFTVGGFYKNIKDLIFFTGRRAIIDPKEYGLPEDAAGKVISGFMNNPHPVKVKGFELEWQTHFWYLPGALKGLILNVNYTRSFSEAYYPRTVIKTEYLTEPPWIRTTNIDTFYTDRITLQPDHIFNATLGFDYKGFSIRMSILYQSDIFKQNNFYSELRGYSDAYTRWDVSIRQTLPLKGAQLLFNLNNLFNAVERDLNQGTGFPLKEQYYGMTANIGLRFKL